MCWLRSMKVVIDKKFKVLKIWKNNKLGVIMDFENEDFKKLMEYEFFKNDVLSMGIFLKYITVRIDLKNYGAEKNDVILLENSDLNSTIFQPEYFTDYEGVGKAIFSRKGIIDLKIKCINKGRFNLRLRAMKITDVNNNTVPIYIDYTKLSVNEKDIFNSRISVSYYNSYTYIKEVENNEILDIHIEWLPFHTQSIFRG